MNYAIEFVEMFKILRIEFSLFFSSNQNNRYIELLCLYHTMPLLQDFINYISCKNFLSRFYIKYLHNEKTLQLEH